MLSPEKCLRFQCSEESSFYRECAEKLVFSNPSLSGCLLELGSGDGSPIIPVLSALPAPERPVVHGYEINQNSFGELVSNIHQATLQNSYIPHAEPFFDTSLPDCDIIISNPPYLPHESGDFPCSYLWGGENGNELSQRLLGLTYPHVMMIVSSYSDPNGLLKHARSLGYRISDFILQRIQFGPYSREPEVFLRIQELHQQGKAFFDGEHYHIAGVLFSLHNTIQDKNEQLIQSLSTF